MSSSSKLVIGLIGPQGAGKDTFFDIFKRLLPENLGVAQVRTSDVLRETLSLWGQDLTRDNLQSLAIYMKEMCGPDIIACIAHERIERAPEKIVFLNGLRWEADIITLSSFPRHALVYITAAPTFRFRRMKARREKVGEEFMSWEEFMTQEQRPTETLISDLGKTYADAVIINEGSLSDFKERTHNVIVRTPIISNTLRFI